MQVRELSFDDISEMQAIANIIRKQIGISTLMACGAREWRFLEDGKKGTGFRVNAGVKREYISISLEPNDTYTVKHYKLKRVTNEEIILSQFNDVYCEMLSNMVYRMVNK